MAGPYPGFGPNNASMQAIEPSWYERLIQAISEARSGEWFDPESRQTLPAGGRLGAVATELTGLAGASRTVANARAGHPVVDKRESSYARQYGDVLDTAGLAAGAAPAVALGLRGLGKVAGAAGDVLSVTPGSKTAQRGAIRAGGWESLIPSHATDLRGLEKARDSLGPNMLYSPSIGINLNKVNRFKDQNAEGTVYLIPKIGAFDPATSASVLYNRDAYLPRHGSYALNQWGGGKTGENLAFDKGLANLRLIGGEGKQIPKQGPESIQMTWSNTAGHKAALANSPHFRSFAQYESSPAGAATLVKGPKSQVIAGVEPLYNGYRDEMQNLARHYKIPFRLPTDQARFSAIYRPLLYGNRVERNSILTSVEQLHGPKAAQELSKVAAKYRKKFSQAPAEYAELQPQGLTPLNEENWAGALVAGGAETGAKLSRILNNLPIERFDPGTLTPDAMKRFQGEYGLARRQPIGQALQLPREFRNDPKTPAPYLTGLAGAGNGVQKGAQNTFQPPKGKPDAWAFTGLPVDKDLKELLEGNFTGELDAQQHLNYVAEQLPLTKGAEKADYEASLAATLHLMKQKGWKPNGMAHQFLAGLDEVFPVLGPEAVQAAQKAEQKVSFSWLPDADYIPEDELIALQKFAGKANDTNLQQALFEYSSLSPESIGQMLPDHDAVLEKVKAAFLATPKPWGVKVKSGSLPDLIGESSTPAGVLDKVLGKDWDVEAADGDVAQAIIAHWGWKIKPDTLSQAIEKAPSWTQDNIIKLLVQQGVKIGNATPEETLAALSKPLTSTGDLALDAEIDALAKGLDPISGSPETELSPTGIPWENIAGSFDDLFSNPSGKAQDVWDFVELFKEAGGKLTENPGGENDVLFAFTGPDGKGHWTSLSELQAVPQHFALILKALLPQVYSHLQVAP